MEQSEFIKWSSTVEKRFENIIHAVGMEQFDRIDELLVQLQTCKFKYTRKGDLKRALHWYLTLWQHSLDSFQKVSLMRFRHSYFHLIVAIVKRSEFSLDYTTVVVEKESGYTQLIKMFQDEDVDGIHIGAEIRRYKTLLYNTVSILTRMDLDQDARPPNAISCELDQLQETKQIAEVLAIVFFRLPGQIQMMSVDVIRSMVAKNIYICPASRSPRLHKVERTLINRLDHAAPRCEWKDADKAFIDNNPSLFHWCWIDLGSVKEIAEDAFKAWFARKMHDVFFLNEYIRSISTHVVRVARCEHREIIWETIPAYRHMLRLYVPVVQYAYVWTCKKMSDLMDAAVNDSEYEDALVECKPIYPISHTATKHVFQTSCVLLADRRLLNIWLRLVFENTSVHCPRAVAQCLDRIRYWINAVGMLECGRVDCQHIGPQMALDERDIDFDYFFKALSILLRSNHFEVLRATLEFLYYYLGVFQSDFRERISRFLLEHNMFLSLFLHWSKECRHMFHYLLVFKVFKHPRMKLNIDADKRLGISITSSPDSVEKQKQLTAINVSQSCDEYQTDRKIAMLLDDVIVTLLSSSMSEEPQVLDARVMIYVKPSLEHYHGLLEEYYQSSLHPEYEAPNPTIICQTML